MTRKRGWGSAADAYKCGACGEFYVPKWDFIGAIVNRVGVSVRERGEACVSTLMLIQIHAYLKVVF